MAQLASDIAQQVVRALPDPRYLTALQEHFREYVFRYDDAEQAELFVRTVRPLVREQRTSIEYNPDLIRGYEELLTTAEFYAFPWLREDERIDLFRRHFSIAVKLSENLDLWKKVKLALLADYPIDRRDEFKAKLRRALEQNQEEITSQLLVSGGGTVRPTIGNWLKDYVANVGLGLADSLKQAEYLTRGKNVTVLNEQQRAQVKWLIEFYENLKRSSLTKEGIEEVLSTNANGQEVLVERGQIEEIPAHVHELIEKFKKVGLISSAVPEEPSAPAKPSSKRLPAVPSSVPSRPPAVVEPQQVAPKVPAASLATNEAEKLLRRWQGQQLAPAKVLDLLLPAVYKGDKDTVLAALRYLALRGELGRVEGEPRLAALMAKRAANTATQGKAAALRFVLEDRLRLSTRESAAIGAELAAVAHKRNPSFTYLAYYDEASGEYHWL